MHPMEYSDDVLIIPNVKRWRERVEVYILSAEQQLFCGFFKDQPTCPGTVGGGIEPEDGSLDSPLAERLGNTSIREVKEELGITLIYPKPIPIKPLFYLWNLKGPLSDEQKARV